jgi:hypothetical protein
MGNQRLMTGGSDPTGWSPRRPSAGRLEETASGRLAGSKMIIWGGYAGNQRTTPAAFSIRSPTAGRRRRPRARLPRGARPRDRGRLIVFGGWDGHTDVNTGGLTPTNT